VIVCHCKAVADRSIRAAVRKGARCPNEVGRACGAGSVCGGCRPMIAELINEHAAESHAAPLVPASAELAATA
jgi:bacterioferritin-associated ferredoxin